MWVGVGNQSKEGFQAILFSTMKPLTNPSFLAYTYTRCLQKSSKTPNTAQLANCIHSNSRVPTNQNSDKSPASSTDSSTDSHGRQNCTDRSEKRRAAPRTRQKVALLDDLHIDLSVETLDLKS